MIFISTINHPYLISGEFYQPFIIVNLMLGSKSTITLEFLIDTGFEGFICVSNQEFYGNNLHKLIDHTITTYFVDLTGNEFECDVVPISAIIPSIGYEKNGFISSTVNITENIVRLEFLEDFELTLNGKKKEFIIKLI